MLFSLWHRVLDAICVKWVRVKGHSMHPTLKDGDWVRVDRRAYRKCGPRRFDIVLLEHPRRAGLFELKRVVGLPCERVALASEELTIDGVHVEQPIDASGSGRSQWELGADEHAVLGDNRSRSTDSRDFGAVHRRSIVGRVKSTGK